MDYTMAREFTLPSRGEIYNKPAFTGLNAKLMS